MAKQLVQLVIAGAQVVGKAFTNAVRQEIRMSQEAARRNAERKGESPNSAHATENLRLGMTLEESKQILNVEALDRDLVEKNYEHLFKVNDQSEGGTLYLQSKVVRAKERIDQEIALSQNKQGEEPPSPPS